jgi:hypothetical protein
VTDAIVSDYRKRIKVRSLEFGFMGFSRDLIIISRLLKQVGGYQVSKLGTPTRRGDDDETLLRYRPT